VPRAQHNISRANISANALKVLQRLHNSGFQAYLVGGCVRDLLLGHEPKDFDVATDATPEQVRGIFRNCRLIGRRFRLAHVHFGEEVIEVATFRAGHDQAESGGKLNDEGMIVRDNVYGTLEDDAWRRDFTVNALYYNIADFSLVDYTGGLGDLEFGRLRMIGEPFQRMREDPVRMLRAVRFAGKLGFRIDDQAEDAIIKLGYLMDEVPSARLFDEVVKLFHTGYAEDVFGLLRHYDLFRYLFPETDELLGHQLDQFPYNFVAKALASTAQRVREDKPVNPAFLYAAMLWEPVRTRAEVLRDQGLHPQRAMEEAAERVIAEQVRITAIPKRISQQSREIWELQDRLMFRGGKRAIRLFEQKRFRAGYDFLVLRNASGEYGLQELTDWWTRFQEVGDVERHAMMRAIDAERTNKGNTVEDDYAGNSIHYVPGGYDDDAPPQSQYDKRHHDQGETTGPTGNKRRRRPPRKRRSRAPRSGA